MSIESDLSVISGDGQSSTSQETTIVRDGQGDVVRNGEVKGHHRSPSHMHRFDKLQPTEVKDILLIFLFVVKHLSEVCLTFVVGNLVDGIFIFLFVVGVADYLVATIL